MRSIDDLDVHGKRVLVRVDFNVPLDANVDAVRGPAAGGVPLVSDDTRIAAALATIEEWRERGRGWCWCRIWAGRRASVLADRGVPVRLLAS